MGPGHIAWWQGFWRFRRQDTTIFPVPAPQGFFNFSSCLLTKTCLCGQWENAHWLKVAVHFCILFLKDRTVLPTQRGLRSLGRGILASIPIETSYVSTAATVIITVHEDISHLALKSAWLGVVHSKGFLERNFYSATWSSTFLAAYCHPHAFYPPPPRHSLLLSRPRADSKNVTLPKHFLFWKRREIQESFPTLSCLPIWGVCVCSSPYTCI